MTKNYTVPASITAASLGTSFTWNGYNALTSSTAPNSATSNLRTIPTLVRLPGRRLTGVLQTSPTLPRLRIGRWRRRVRDGASRRWMASAARLKRRRVTTRGLRRRRCRLWRRFMLRALVLRSGRRGRRRCLRPRVVRFIGRSIFMTRWGGRCK